jgi:hypothetical protein
MPAMIALASANARLEVDLLARLDRQQIVFEDHRDSMPEIDQTHTEERLDLSLHTLVVLGRGGHRCTNGPALRCRRRGVRQRSVVAAVAAVAAVAVVAAVAAVAVVRRDGQRLPLVPGRQPGLVVRGGDG